MNLFVQSLLVFGVILLFLGYFQYRRSGDILSVFTEMARPTYLVPAGIAALCYLILKSIFSLLGGVLK